MLNSPLLEVLLPIVAVSVLVIWFILFVKFVIIWRMNRHFIDIENEIKEWIPLGKVNIKDGKIWDNKIIVEYQLPKWLNPTEVWFLYDSHVWKEDIVCMIYKWAHMWLVSLNYEWWRVIVQKLTEAQFWMPEYEYVFWNIVFRKWDIVKFPNRRIYGELTDVKESLLNYCERMWRVARSSVHFSLDSLFGHLSWSSKNFKKISYIPFWRLIWLLIWFLMIVYWFVVAANAYRVSEYLLASCVVVPFVGVFIMFGFINSLNETQDKKAVKLTKEWEKIIAQIYWYKQFLESCEERQLTEFMRQDPLYLDKILPYAVALGLKNIISTKIPKNVVLDDEKTMDILRLEKVF